MACSRLASLWPLLLPRPVPGSLLSEAYQSLIAVASVNGTVVAGERRGMCESALTSPITAHPRELPHHEDICGSPSVAALNPDLGTM
jgi:hypothetical protein